MYKCYDQTNSIHVLLSVFMQYIFVLPIRLGEKGLSMDCKISVSISENVEKKKGCTCMQVIKHNIDFTQYIEH